MRHPPYLLTCMIAGAVSAVLAVKAISPRDSFAQQFPDSLQRGFVLKSYRGVFALTQAQLAALSGVSSTRISKLERGVIQPDTSDERKLGRVLDSIVHARISTATASWVDRVHARFHPLVLTPFPPAPVYPRTAIVYGRTVCAPAPCAYRVVAPGHGLSTGFKAIVRDHRATPSFDSLRLWVRILGDTAVLYRDSLRTQPVTTTAFGTGGTIQRQP